MVLVCFFTVTVIVLLTPVYLYVSGWEKVKTTSLLAPNIS